MLVIMLFSTAPAPGGVACFNSNALNHPTQVLVIMLLFAGWPLSQLAAAVAAPFVRAPPPTPVLVCSCRLPLACAAAL